MAYPLADLLVVQTQDIADWCAQAFQLQTSPEVIPNPIDLQMFRPPQDCRSKGFKSSAMNTMVSVGRLESQKGMDHLIRVFHRIAEQHPDWSLDIYGEGSARLELQQQIDSAGLSRRVRLCKWQRCSHGCRQRYPQSGHPPSQRGGTMLPAPRPLVM